MKAVLVGEAWGKTEDEFKHALVGPTGRELSLQLGITKFAPFMNLLCRKCKRETQFISKFCEHCNEYVWPNEFTLIDHWKRLRNDHGIAVTNVFQERPRDNNLGYWFGTEPSSPMPGYKASKTLGGSHVYREIYEKHVKRLWIEIADMNPTLIVAMGNVACWALLGQTKITSLRGTVSRTDKNLTNLDIKLLPTFHPAAILRQPSMRVAALSDFTKATREVEFPEIRRPKRWITIPSPDAAGIRECYEWLKRPAFSYACDIETKNRQITMIGFARAADDVLVVPLRNVDGQPSDPNFWPTPELEVEALRFIIKILDTPVSKTFQNGVYDLSSLLRMGIHVRNSEHDTMLWHHSEYPELPKSLGFLGSLYANDIAWKQMVRHDSLKRDE